MFLDVGRMEKTLENYCDPNYLQFRWQGSFKCYKGALNEDLRFKLLDDGGKILLLVVTFKGSDCLITEMSRRISKEIILPQEQMLIEVVEITDHSKTGLYFLHIFGWCPKEEREGLRRWKNSIVSEGTIEKIL